MKKSGHADLPLHYGRVPAWLYERMARMGGAIVEAIIAEYGTIEVLRRLSDPFWFQAFGAVLGMDWHSSGITTSVMGALKQAINPVSKDLGLYVCGGRGKYSLQTPMELFKYSDKTGINGNQLVRCSRLTARIDNNAIQDGFQIYLHSFIVTKDGEWSVIQQGLNDQNGLARRYHWHSVSVKSFVEEPHTFICGENMGKILNLTHIKARETRAGILSLSKEKPSILIPEVKNLVMSKKHEVTSQDVDMKRLGALIALAYEHQFKQFDDLLLLEGLGPKTLRSLTLISEIMHGTPSRFEDPARFSFAHGGKDGYPFPIQTSIYDKSYQILKRSIDKAKIGNTDKQKAIKKLVSLVQTLEKGFVPNKHNYKKYIEKERRESKFVGGRTVYDKKKLKINKNTLLKQLRLFE